MTTFKNIDLKSFQKQCLKIFCFEIPKPLFSNGKSVVFGKPAEYFPDLEKGEKLVRNMTMVILLVFLLPERMPFAIFPIVLTSFASVLISPVVIRTLGKARGYCLEHLHW